MYTTLTLIRLGFSKMFKLGGGHSVAIILIHLAEKTVKRVYFIIDVVSSFFIQSF